MAPPGVTESLDVVEDIGTRGVGLLEHAADQVVLAQQCLPLMACELTPLIGMRRDGPLGLATPLSHQPRIKSEAGVDPAPHRPAHRLAREQIHHDGQIQPAFVRTDAHRA